MNKLRKKLNHITIQKEKNVNSASQRNYHEIEGPLWLIKVVKLVLKNNVRIDGSKADWQPYVPTMGV